jgi:hypothetical protein
MFHIRHTPCFRKNDLSISADGKYLLKADSILASVSCHVCAKELRETMQERMNRESFFIQIILPSSNILHCHPRSSIVQGHRLT